MSPFTLRFELRDVEQVAAWGAPHDKMLHWFALTDGCYCIDTPAGTLLDRNGEPDSELGLPWCTYQVARLFEDLIEAWPAISEPVPEDVIDYFLGWQTNQIRCSDKPNTDLLSEALTTWRADNLARGVNEIRPMRERLDEATRWWTQRQIDFGYLQPAPTLRLWRSGQQLHLEWDAQHPWAVAHARLSLPHETVAEAVTSFCHEFLLTMRRRVETIVRDGWTRTDCSVDVPRLVAEQYEREKAVAGWCKVHVTNWESIRVAIKQVEQLVDSQSGTIGP
jgi:hypothetical protein